PSEPSESRPRKRQTPSAGHRLLRRRGPEGRGRQRRHLLGGRSRPGGQQGHARAHPGGGRSLRDDDPSDDEIMTRSQTVPRDENGRGMTMHTSTSSLLRRSLVRTAAGVAALGLLGFGLTGPAQAMTAPYSVPSSTSTTDSDDESTGDDATETPTGE